MQPALCSLLGNRRRRVRPAGTTASRAPRILRRRDRQRPPRRLDQRLLLRHIRGNTVNFGDARSDRISDLWFSSEGIICLRTPGLTRLKGICGNCVFPNTCRGYCRAQALDEYGDIDAPYPICQHFAEAGRFPARYMINPEAGISYQPDLASVTSTSALLPRGDSRLRHLPLVPLTGRERGRK